MLPGGQPAACGAGGPAGARRHGLGMEQGLVLLLLLRARTRREQAAADRTERADLQGVGAGSALPAAAGRQLQRQGGSGGQPPGAPWSQAEAAPCHSAGNG